MLYMLMICYDPSIPPNPDEPNRQPEHARLEAEMREAGVYVSGAGLWPMEQAKVVRHEGSKALVTDGPFTETKEAVGGYFTIDCDEEQAIEYAKRIQVGSNGWIQMRPIALFHPNAERIPDVENYVDPRLLGRKP